MIHLPADRTGFNQERSLAIMPDSTIISSGLLEPDGVYQNVTVAVGITVKPIPGGKVRLAITDTAGEATILLSEAERLHLINLLTAHRPLHYHKSKFTNHLTKQTAP